MIKKREKHRLVIDSMRRSFQNPRSWDNSGTSVEKTKHAKGTFSEIKKCPFCDQLMLCPACKTPTRSINKCWTKRKVKSVTCFCNKCNKYFTHREKALVKQLEKFEASWIAALLDGEGTFHATVRKKGVTPFLEIVNTSKELIDKVREVVGYGAVIPVKRPPPRKMKYVWILYSHGSRELLPQIIPFLIIKKKAAVALLNYLNAPSWNRDWNEMSNAFKAVRQKIGSKKNC